MKKELKVAAVFCTCVFIFIYFNTYSSSSRLTTEPPSISDEESKIFLHAHGAGPDAVADVQSDIASKTTLKAPDTNQPQLPCGDKCQWNMQQRTRKNILMQGCKDFKENTPNNLTDFIMRNKHVLQYLYYSDKHKVFYCEVPKAGCTNFKTLFFALNNGNSLDTFKRPRMLHVYMNKWRMSNIEINKISEIVHRLETYQSLLIARHPFTRLVFAYTDKLVNHKDHPLWVKYRKIINGRNNETDITKQVSFPGLVRYVTNPKVRNLFSGDQHWIPVNELCHPCQIRYDNIGKLETIEEDAAFILEKIGARKLLNLVFKQTKHQTHSNNTAKLSSFLSKLSSDEVKLFNQRYEKGFRYFDYDKDYLKSQHD